ncbi:MAG: type II secretion system protein GspG [Armatimonadota bacterium]
MAVPRSLRRGFTLIELIVVILIIAILAALVVPNLINRTSQAKVAKAQSDISTLSGLIQQFRIDCGRFPTTEEGLQALRTAPSNVQGWRGPYSTKEIPNDPWGNPYQYQWPGALGEESFSILSYGADGAPGGTGDNADITEGDQ